MKNNWYWIVIIVLMISVFFLWNNTSRQDAEIQKLTALSKEQQSNAEYYKELYGKQINTDKQLSTSYDSLTLIKNKIQINEKIKLVDRYNVSDMQSYFTDRYGSK